MALQTFSEFKNSKNQSANTGGSSSLQSFSEFKKTYVPPVTKKTLGEKITNVAKGVTDFVGGKALSEAIGGTIAINQAEKRGDTKAMALLGADLPTNKQTLASIGEVALNTVPLGIGLGTGSKVATKVITSIPRLIGEGAAYGAAQSGLRSVQNGNDILSKETLKNTAVGGALGGIIGGVLGGVGKLISKKLTPTTEKVIQKEITPTIDNGITKEINPVIKETPIISQIGQKSINPETPIITPEPIIGAKPSIEASRLNENLVKQGFDELPQEQKATYNAFQVKEQTQKITQHLDTNYEGFKQAVLDNKIPSDIQPTMAFNAVKNKAIQEGDFETQRLLAKSPLASLSSQAGSTLRATQEFSIEGADSVTIMQKLNQELEKTTEKKLGKSVVQAKQELINNAEQTFKSEVKKITSKQSVADFINSIPDC